MAAYNYTQWSATVQPASVSAAQTDDPSAYAAYQAAAYQSAGTLDANHAYYQAMAASPYGANSQTSPAPVPVPAPTPYSTQYPAPTGVAQPTQPSVPHSNRAPAPIGTKSRGPFEAQTRPRGVPPVRQPLNVGSGGPSPRNLHPRGQGPGNQVRPGGQGGPGPRAPRPLLGGDFSPRGGSSGFRPRGPRPPFGDSDEWRGPPDRWGGPPDRWGGPRGPPGRWEDDNWNSSSGNGRWGSSDRWERGPKSGRDRDSFDKGRRRDEKPPPLMGPDYEIKRRGRDSRKRQRSGSSSDRHSKRHVDEDLNVTIVDEDFKGSGKDAPSKDGDRYYCTLCKVTIKKGYEFQQHLRGRRHKQRAADQKAAGKDATDDADNPNDVIATDKDMVLDDTLTLMPLDDPDKLRFYCTICRLALLTEMNKKAHEATPNHLKRVNEVEELKKKAEEDKSVCVYCVVVYKATEEDEHKTADGHKQSLHWRMASCEICTCKFNDTVELEKHFKTNRHYKQFERLKSNGLSHEKMTKYYEHVQAAIQEKRQSFCIICTTACGNAENLEIHNAVAAKYHDKMNREASKAGPNQFYCFCCKKILDESDRRFHGKSMKHKMTKDRYRSWDCEDCNLTFDQERKLYPHLQCKAHFKMVERRKAIQRYTLNKFITEWKGKQAEAHKQIVAQLTKQKVAGESTDDKEASKETENSDSTEEVDALAEGDNEVIPISGHYCTICKKFYQFDAGRKNICSHVKKAKGIKDKSSRNKEGKEVDEVGGDNSALHDDSDKEDVNECMDKRLDESLQSGIEEGAEGLEGAEGHYDDVDEDKEVFAEGAKHHSEDEDEHPDDSDGHSDDQDERLEDGDHHLEDDFVKGERGIEEIHCDDVDERTTDAAEYTESISPSAVEADTLSVQAADDTDIQ